MKLPPRQVQDLVGVTPMEVRPSLGGRILGTPSYMAPEQAEGDAHSADRRADVYSLGVILFELLTGERPFRGNTRMLLHQVIHEEAPNPRKFAPTIPRDLETLTLKCLEKDPTKRFQSTEEFSEELHRFLAGQAILSRPTGRLERGWRWCKRNLLVASLALGIVLLLSVGMCILTTLWIKADQNAKEANHFSEQYRIESEKAQEQFAKDAEEAVKNEVQFRLTFEKELRKSNSYLQIGLNSTMMLFQIEELKPLNRIANLSNLGVLLQAQGKLQEAESAYLASL